MTPEQHLYLVCCVLSNGVGPVCSSSCENSFSGEFNVPQPQLCVSEEDLRKACGTCHQLLLLIAVVSASQRQAVPQLPGLHIFSSVVLIEGTGMARVALSHVCCGQPSGEFQRL